MVVHGFAALVAALLISQPQHLNEIKGPRPRLYLALMHAMQLSRQFKPTRRIAGAASASQAVDARRVDEQRGGLKLEVDGAGELAAFFHYKVAQHAERRLAPQRVFSHLE